MQPKKEQLMRLNKRYNDIAVDIRGDRGYCSRKEWITEEIERSANAKSIGAKSIADGRSVWVGEGT